MLRFINYLCDPTSSGSIIFPPSTWGPFQAHQQLMVSPSLLYSPAFFTFLAKSKYLFIFSLFFFLLFSSLGEQNPQNCKFFFLLCQNWLGLFLSRLGDPFVSQNLSIFYTSIFLGQILVCTKTIFNLLQNSQWITLSTQYMPIIIIIIIVFLLSLFRALFILFLWFILLIYVLSWVFLLFYFLRVFTLVRVGGLR